jgi:hypothetical protein
MGPMSIAWIVLACVFGGAVSGVVLRLILPERHLSSDSKDVIKLAMGLTATMAALVLALLISAAKSSYDAQRNEVTQLAANVVLLDRVLAHYGPETKPARDMLSHTAAGMIGRIWTEDRTQAAAGGPTAAGGEAFFDEIQELSPKNDIQRSLLAQALKMSIDLGQTRLLLFEQSGRSIPMAFLVLLIFWVTIIYVSFGLFAPPNATVIVTLFLCALSISGAIFLILELDRPFGGLVEISSAPLRNAVAQLGK